MGGCINSCLLSFLLISLTAVAVLVLSILFILKPKKPLFHLHAIRTDPLFELDVAEIEQGFISLPMVSLLFATQNPNKLGIRYSSTDLRILYDDSPIGLVEVPAFYQPPHSVNVTIIVHTMFDLLNISKFVGRDSNNQHRDHIQVIGSIGVQGHILMFLLPKFKVYLLIILCSSHVSLNCRIDLNFADFLLSKQLHFTKVHKDLVSNLPHLSQKCSLALDM